MLYSFLFFVFHFYASCKEITSLPGYDKPFPFKLYGDYIPVPGTHRKYFYLFAESYEPSDIMMVWFNGGPGCSSLEGFAVENGPFKLQTDGSTLELNEYSWNKLGNVLYIEAPAGVGFSEDLGVPPEWNDDQFAADVYQVLVGFLTEFPEMKQKDMYLTGESYAGFYVPVLSKYIQDHSDISNLKGFAIGNGCMDRPKDVNSWPNFLREHLIITEDFFEHLMSVCKGDPWTHQDEKECGKAYDLMEDQLFYSGINPYYLYDECDPDLSAMLAKGEGSKYYRRYNLPIYKKGENDITLPQLCTSTADVEKYWNTPAVKTAIHANTSIHWSICWGESYKWIYDTMVPFYESILKDYRGVFFSGDCDSVVNGVGSRQGIELLNLKILNEWRKWKVGKQTAGFVVNYEGLDFVTVRGAGHMVPQVKPQRAYEMLKRFLEGNCC